MPETNWNSKLQFNDKTKGFTAKWTRKKRSLRGSTIYGNHRQFYKAKLGLNHLNNKELKELSKKQMIEMLKLTMKNKLITEKNESSEESNRPNSFSNPILNHSNSPPVKTRLLVTRKRPMPWTVQRRARLSQKDYNNQTGRLLRNK